MKIIFHPNEAWGHIYASIGMAQIMFKRGHRIIFIISEKVQGQFLKYGFEELILKDENEQNSSVSTSWLDCNHHYRDHVYYLIHSNLFIEKDPLKKYGMFEKIMEARMEEILKTDLQLKRFIEREQPDMIIVDQILVSPMIIHCNIPWCSIFSCNPISFRNDPRLPPPFSGLPSNDQTLWPVYRKEFVGKYHSTIITAQNRLMKHYGYDSLCYEGITPPSPYLNIYGYPEELDYIDVAPIPPKYFRIDTFCRDEPDVFELPMEFINNLHPNSKLIYISLGTLASVRFDMIKKILNILATTKHGFIISKGQFDDGFQLPKNMFGLAHLPQTKVLPMVDLVITHGGNNTFTETLTYGKPMIIMPFFVDQYDNAKRIQEKGYGVQMNPFDFEGQDLIDTVERLLNDKKLNEKLAAISKRIQSSNVRDKLAEYLEQMVASTSSCNEQKQN